MKFGCCLNMASTRVDGIGAEFLEAADKMGYDYVELPLAEMMELDDASFERLRERIGGLTVKCEACNNFFPKSMRLTGREADMEENLEYAEKALSRAKALGVSVVVFGSGPAKNVPDGDSLEMGYRQVKRLLREISLTAAKKGILICIEPLRRAECNLINTFEGGCRLAEEIAHPNIQVLADYYHMMEEREPVDHLRRYGKDHLRHVHFARSAGRRYPVSIEEEGERYREFFDALSSIGYGERVSCEAYTQDFLADAPRTIEFFRKSMDTV